MTKFSPSSALQTNATLPLVCAPHVAAVTDEVKVRMMLVIHDVTEQLRERLQADPLWGSEVHLPPRGFRPRSLHGAEKPRTLGDQLAWPSLLTMGSCLEKASQEAGCEREELLMFAMFICPYEYLPHLLQYASFQAGIKDTARLLSPVVQSLKAKEARIRRGASIGGQKSAKTRAQGAKTPSVEILRREAQKLLDIGKESSAVAGILSSRYGVTSTTIRRKLRQS